MWVNTVGPWYNPHESYSYYSLPFCVPNLVDGTQEKRPSGLGEILTGHKLVNSGVDVKFKGANQYLCLLAETQHKQPESGALLVLTDVEGALQFLSDMSLSSVRCPESEELRDFGYRSTTYFRTK